MSNHPTEPDAPESQTYTHVIRKTLERARDPKRRRWVTCTACGEKYDASCYYGCPLCGRTR